jgi:hypothetical protein
MNTIDIKTELKTKAVAIKTAKKEVGPLWIEFATLYRSEDEETKQKCWAPYNKAQQLHRSRYLDKREARALHIAYAYLRGKRFDSAERWRYELEGTQIMILFKEPDYYSRYHQWRDDQDDAIERAKIILGFEHEPKTTVHGRVKFINDQDFNIWLTNTSTPYNIKA